MTFQIAPNYYLGATNNGSFTVGAVGTNCAMIISNFPIGTCTGFMTVCQSVGTNYNLVSSIYSVGTLGTRASDIPIVEGTCTAVAGQVANKHTVGTFVLNTPLVITTGTDLAHIITGTEARTFSLTAGNTQRLTTGNPGAYVTTNKQATWGLAYNQQTIPVIPIYDNGSGPFNPILEYEKPMYVISNHTSATVNGTGVIVGNEIAIPSGSTAYSIGAGINHNGAGAWDLSLLDTSNAIVSGPHRVFRNTLSQTNPCPVNFIRFNTPIQLNNSRYRLIVESVNAGTITVGTCDISGTNNSTSYFFEKFSAVGTTGTAFRGTKVGAGYTVTTYIPGLHDIKLMYEPPATTGTSAAVSGESISLFF
jgi:hypothetical protein